MNVLVTGGGGYLGSVLVEKLLEKQQSVIALDIDGKGILPYYGHEAFTYIKGEIRDRILVHQALEGVDAVVHLAAIVGASACEKNPELAKQVNEESTYHLVKMSKEMGIKRFVFVNTASVYGVSEGKADEESPVKITSLYTATKMRAEKYVLDCESQSFHPCVLRLATLYGLSPKPQFNSLLNELVWSAAFKKEILIYGSMLYRPIVHVRDAARAIVICLTAPLERISGQVFNVGEGCYRKIEMANSILRYFPEANIKVVDTKKDVRNYKVSFEKISKILGFTTHKTIDDGIAEIKDAIEKGVIIDNMR